MTSKHFPLIGVASIAMVLAACGNIGTDRRDERGTTALMRAAARGDTAEVALLIAGGADVNAEVPQRDLREIIAVAAGQELPTADIGYTPLLYATKHGRAHVARILIDRGADVHHATSAEETAFSIAFRRSDVRIMRLVTAAGVRPTAQQLAKAIENSTPEVVGLLLQRGADPNALPPGESGRAARPLLIAATIRGDPVVVKLLVDSKANINARDANGWTALRWAHDAATRRKAPNAAQMITLLETAGARDDAGAKAIALFDAVHKKDIARVRAALRDGANPNARDNDSVRPLNYAATLGATDIVAALIAAGAHLNLSPFAPYGPTPLNAAIENGHIGVVKQLLGAGASADQRDRTGRTPLMMASLTKRADMTALLLADSATAEPWALSLAVRNGDTAQVRMLLDHGADPNYGSAGLYQAASACRDQNNTAVIRLLLERGAKPKALASGFSTPLHRAAALCDTAAVRLLLVFGADPNARDMNRRTPLIAAAEAGKLENVRVLIEAGADVNLRDGDDKTALVHASKHPEVQQELRRAAARSSKVAGK